MISTVVANTAAAEKAAVEKAIAAETAAVRKAAAADWEAAEKTPAAVKAGVEKVIAAAVEREAKRAAAEKAAAEQVATKERTKGEKKKKKETRQPRNQKNGQFVAAPPIPTTPSAPGREEVHAQEAAEFEAAQRTMDAGGKCPWSKSEFLERSDRLEDYEIEKQIRRDQDPNPSLIKGSPGNHLYTREEVLAPELKKVLNPGTDQWVSVRQLRNNFFPPESWIRSSRRS